MKILQVINNLGSGGAEKLLETLIPAMKNYDNVQVDVLLLTDYKNVFETTLVREGIKVYTVKYKKIYDVRNIMEIKKYIEGGNYDAVHSHLFPSQYWVALSKLLIKNKNIKFITTEHSTHNRRRGNFFFKVLDKFIYAKYDSIISITNEVQESLIKWIKPKKKINKFSVIKNGVNTENINKVTPYKKNKLIEGIDDDTRLICMVGRFSEGKDQSTLIRAMEKLPRNVHLVLIGEGKLLKQNKQLVEKLRIEKKVSFMGFREDVPSILKTVDIVVLSSNWEGFGIAAVEGMAANKPVVVSNVKGLSEVVRGAGLLFSKGNTDELAKQLNKLLSDEIFYREIKEACFKQSERFNIDKMSQKYYELLMATCENK